MRTSIARAALLCTLLAAAGAARAQQDQPLLQQDRPAQPQPQPGLAQSYKPLGNWNSAYYAVSIPVGSFADDFISTTSFRGVGFDTRTRLTDLLSVGVGVDYARFEQTFSQLSVPAGTGGTLSGPVFRFADQFSLKGTVHAYYPAGPVTAYGGLGIGAVWSYAVQQTTDLMKTENSTDMVVAPEVGVAYALARGAWSTGLNAAVRYNWTKASFLGVTNAQTVQLVIGLFAAY